MLFISRKNLLMLPYLYLLKCIQIKTFFSAQHIFYNDLAIHFLLRNISEKQTWLKKSAVKVKQQQRLLSKLIPINSPVFVFLKTMAQQLETPPPPPPSLASQIIHDETFKNFISSFFN